MLAKSFGVERAVAAEWFDISTAEFRRWGLLGSAPETQETILVPGAARETLTARHARLPRQTTYRIFEQLFHISSPPELEPTINNLLGSLRVVDPADAPGFPIAILGRDAMYNVLVDERIEVSCERGSLVGHLERMLLQIAVTTTPHLLSLHAGALHDAERTIILAGPSGCGKTTLSVALARAGWAFGSDELVLLGRSLELRPLPFPACIKASSFALVESWFPELPHLAEHARFGNRVKFLPLPNAPFRRMATHVLFPRHDPDSVGEIKELDGFTGLQRARPMCIRFFNIPARGC